MIMTPFEAYFEILTKQNQNKRISKKKISKLERIISTDSQYSYFYTFNIIKGSWEEGEDIISKHPYWSYKYARDIIRKPFEKCHYIIFDSSSRNFYIKFLKSINYDLDNISEWLI